MSDTSFPNQSGGYAWESTGYGGRYSGVASAIKTLRGDFPIEEVRVACGPEQSGPLHLESFDLCVGPYWVGELAPLANYGWPVQPLTQPVLRAEVPDWLLLAPGLQDIKAAFERSKASRLVGTDAWGHGDMVARSDLFESDAGQSVVSAARSLVESLTALRRVLAAYDVVAASRPDRASSIPGERLWKDACGIVSYSL